MPTTLKPQQKATIANAMIALATQRRFDAGDSAYGNELAVIVEQGRSLTALQNQSASKLVQKYSRQLQGLGINLNGVVPLPRPDSAIRPETIAPTSSNVPTIESLRSELGLQQKEAFDALMDWAILPVDDFVLRGGAGVGKSFMIQRFMKALMLTKPDLAMAMCAPTHKARKVLVTFAAKAGLNIEIATLQSLLHVKPGRPDASGNVKLEHNKYACGSNFSNFGMVAIDEASMEGEELLRWVRRHPNTATLHIGDEYQLPPVEHEIDSCDSPIFDFPRGFQLTEQQRYDGAIASYVTALRNDLTNASQVDLESGGNISKLSYTKWLDNALECFESAKESDDVRILAWKNDRVHELNREVRALMRPGIEAHFVEGELLIAKSSVTIRDPESLSGTKMLMHSCQECTVLKVCHGTTILNLWAKSGMAKPVTLDCYKLQIITDVGEVAWITIVHPEGWRTARMAMNLAKASIEDMDGNVRSVYWKRWYEICEAINVEFRGSKMLSRLQYAYAITVHQAQGSTIKKTFVDINNIKTCKQPKLTGQLLYTAGTRASDRLFALSL